MIDNKITYKVIGRYMDGTSVLAYHFVSSKGTQHKFSKDKVNFLIGKGLIENMRVQADGNELKIRGRGINLTMLPIFDENKKALRGNNVRTDNNIGSFKITKRIILANDCIGYVIENSDKKQIKLSVQKTIELAISKNIINADVTKYKSKSTGNTVLKLNGINFDLESLPAIISDRDGNIVDPSKKDGSFKVRFTRMRRGGVIYKNGLAVDEFKAGDLLICGLYSEIKHMDCKDALSKLKIDNECSVAVCDESLDNIENYRIEIFGLGNTGITPNSIKKWGVAKVIN